MARRYRRAILQWKNLRPERDGSDPWTADDPHPGDFDAMLATIDADYVERHEGDPNATLRILVSVGGEDASGRSRRRRPRRRLHITRD
jgi:hypothetical protein